MFGCEEVYCRFDATEPYRFKPLSFDVFVGYRHLWLWLGGWRILKTIVTPPDHSRVYFDAPRVNETIKQELTRKITGEDSRPFFLYAHYMEPHSPYYYHPYRPVQFNIYSERMRESILEAYRSEIKAVDQAIADLYAFLAEKGLLENTYLFIAADHGEEFLDHGDWGHGKSLYPEVISVPAILVPPAGQEVKRSVDAPVENIDVMPTFAELAGVPAADYWEGRSLASFISPAYSTAPYDQHTAYGQFRDDFGRFWATAITDDGWQVVFREAARLKDASEAERREKRAVLLFNLARDPLAKSNLAGQGLDEEARLVSLLEENLRRLELTAHLYQGGEEEIDSKALEQLKALGYIQ
jgi:arylsulfatase A-like enzyme